ncbi:uncharacterized protein LOC118191569 [Stegodyphus dumicola]|uniref:uncharacterized protein LOC118191569 n=1 Tax=Stegodyphus dumicola TaxID=202533 RepID=UPI0015B2BC8F|nr:uncharacterized protein LOC118191569 [Stegodyphus dumicola]
MDLPIHLRSVPLCSFRTDEFLQAFHRFSARRGKPSIIYTDNGTNFVGACNALASIDFNEIAKKGANERIIWKFIPPGAPWWGGWWERLIGMMKRILRKVLGRACLSYEEMYTVLCNCEAILNDRPLTVVSAYSSLTSITPGNFLREIQNYSVPIVKHDFNSSFYKRRLRYIQNVNQVFKKRFRQEYLGTLKTTSKKFARSCKLKEGDIVLIGSDDKRRLNWPLGKIIQLFPGTDGESRRAKIKVQNGKVTRAVQNLYPLELSTAEELPSKFRGFERCENISVEQTPIDDVPVETNRIIHTHLKSPTITKSGRTIRVPHRLDL